MEIKVAITQTYLEAMQKLPKKIFKKATELFEKFKNNPTSSALNYEKIKDMKDENVRTLRVDQKYRAIVVFPTQGNTYTFVYVDDHDLAMDWARNKTFGKNILTDSIQMVDEKFFTEHFTDSGKVNKNEENKPIILENYSEEELIGLGVPNLLIPSLNFIKDSKSLNEYFKGRVSQDIIDILEYCLMQEPIDSIKEIFSQGNQQLENDNLYNELSNSYVKVLTEDEDIKEVLSQGLDSWRIFLHPSQIKLVKGYGGNYKGPINIKGSAGTGKTVVAMHRAKYLLENIYKNDKILYTTFSKKLIKSVEYNLKNMCSMEELKRIDVKNIDALIADYLRKYEIKYRIVTDSQRSELINEAIIRTNQEKQYTVNDIINEIDIVIKNNNIITLDDYLSISRIGAYKKAGKNQRLEMWDIYTEYLQILRDNELFEWWQMINVAIKILNEKKDYQYEAIIVDESQDLGMPEFRFLRAFIPEKENDLFIVGDVKQRIYNSYVNFSKCGINIRGNRSSILKINYRNTCEIGDLAVEVLKGNKYKDLDGERIDEHHNYSLLIGDNPILKDFDNLKDEYNYIIQEINNLLVEGYQLYEIAVVSRTNKYISDFVEFARNHGLKSCSLEEVDISNDMFYYGTMHSIKGFEFRVVFVIGASEEELDLNYYVEKIDNDKEKKSFITLTKSLLYVAITRAREMVYITGVPELSNLISKGSVK